MKFVAVEGGITAPKGFKAAAVMAGIKKPRNDLALIFSERPASAAGVFTTNKVAAAPVHLCRERLSRNPKAQAIVANSGNANACTGPRGDADARTMAALAARCLGIDEKLALVCSTGTIGIPLPMAKIEAAIPAAASTLSRTGGGAAAKAIMTTDTVDKQAAVQVTVDGVPVVIGGMAKGAGMICPNMATLLVFLTTDAAVAPAALKMCLSRAVNQSFNNISVDGDQSTNDTVLLLANGEAGNRPLGPRHPDWRLFCSALDGLTKDLALKVVRDGEGATKAVAITVRGAASAVDAKKSARSVANSLLVKTSWFGGDPNWGRIIAAVGYSGAAVKEGRVDIRYDGLLAVQHGRVAANTALSDLEKILTQKSFSIEIDLHLGKAAYTIYTCDCSEEYVRINAAYMT